MSKDEKSTEGGELIQVLVPSLPFARSLTLPKKTSLKTPNS